MIRLHKIPDDFEAVIQIYTAEEGGRVTPVFNGIRWDLCYAEDRAEAGIYMIWPDFIDHDQNSLPTSQPLPIGVELSARMVILVDEMRERVHRQRIKVGSKFYCHEGAKRVAFGRVTKITGLFKERPSA
jgi:translation elongation factor EF-Tu-like GTPase